MRYPTLPVARLSLSRSRAQSRHRLARLLAVSLGCITGCWLGDASVGWGEGGDRLSAPALAAAPPATTPRPPLSQPLQLAQQLNFNVDNVRPSRGRSGGFARGNACYENPTEATPPTALVPLDVSAEFAQLRVETTVSAQPTFYVFLPTMDVTPQTGELAILAQGDNNTETLVHEQRITIPEQAQGVIVPVNLENDFALTVGQTYRWTLQLMCDATLGDQASNPFAEGWIERVEPGEGLAAMLAQTDPTQHPELYATAGHWYDALASLAMLRRDDPSDPSLRSDWVTLLESVNLGEFADHPFLVPDVAQQAASPVSEPGSDTPAAPIEE